LYKRKCHKQTFAAKKEGNRASAFKIERTGAQPINCKISIQAIPPTKIVLLVTSLGCFGIMSEMSTGLTFGSVKT